MGTSGYISVERITKPLKIVTNQASKQAGVNVSTYVSTSGIEFMISCKGTWRVEE
jgi:hypothetical protein